jgi:hypothetical protein
MAVSSPVYCPCGEPTKHALSIQLFCRFQGRQVVGANLRLASEAGELAASQDIIHCGHQWASPFSHAGPQQPFAMTKPPE